MFVSTFMEPLFAFNFTARAHFLSFLSKNMNVISTELSFYVIAYFIFIFLLKLFRLGDNPPRLWVLCAIVLILKVTGAFDHLLVVQSVISCSPPSSE